MIEWKDKIQEIKKLLGARITASDKELQIMQAAALMSIAESLSNYNYTKLGDVEVATTKVYDDEYGEEIETIIKKNQDKLQSQENSSENTHEVKQNESNDNRGNGHDKPKQQRKLK